MHIGIQQAIREQRAILPEMSPVWGSIAAEPESGITAEHTVEPGFMSTCMNPGCTTGWLKLWRRRHVPRFESQWACGPECMQVLVEQAVERELGNGLPLDPQPHQHRVPLGLLMLSQGWITHEQLRTALEAQRSAGGKGRIGAWLMRQCNLPEERVTRALSMQWGCPVLSLQNHQPEMIATLIPRILLDTYGMVPLRASRHLVYLAFEDRMDATVALAARRMSGMRVEAGVVTASQFLRTHERMMATAFPKTQLVDVASAGEVVRLVAEAVERVRPQQAKLVRMHRYFWLRLWHTVGNGPGGSPLPRIHQVEDLLLRMQREEECAG